MTSTSKVVGPYDITEAELDRMAAERQREYETGEMLDRELGLDEPEDGLDTMKAAARYLEVRGVLLADATQAQLADALTAVSR